MDAKERRNSCEAEGSRCENVHKEGGRRQNTQGDQQMRGAAMALKI